MESILTANLMQINNLKESYLKLLYTTTNTATSTDALSNNGDTNNKVNNNVKIMENPVVGTPLLNPSKETLSSALNTIISEALQYEENLFSTAQRRLYGLSQVPYFQIQSLNLLAFTFSISITTFILCLLYISDNFRITTFVYVFL